MLQGLCDISILDKITIKEVQFCWGKELSYLPLTLIWPNLPLLKDVLLAATLAGKLKLFVLSHSLQHVVKIVGKNASILLS